ncbi:MAG: toll/interleukin-1 receptor domain-containing protein [Bryobacteraceae bacterium]|jgi:hypothetical protein
MADKPSRTDWDVFVSYSSANRKQAECVVQGLNHSGLKVWFDRNQVSPGDYVWDSINAGLNGSRVIVLLASSASIKSRWVLNELDAAMMREIHEKRRVVIPVLLGRINSADLPPDIRGKNYIDLRYGFQRRYATEGTHLVNAIRALLQPGDPDRVAIPLGDVAMRHILSYKYMALLEASEVPNDFLDAVVEAFIRDPGGVTSNAEREKLLENYGRWGARQVLKFFLDHSKIKFTRWFTQGDYEELLSEIDTFLAMMGSQELAAQAGERIEMGIAPDRSIAYRVIDTKST